MQLLLQGGNMSSMKRDRIVPSSDKGRSSGSAAAGKQSPWLAILAWWYRLAAPPEPPAISSLSQRERARRGRQASIVVVIYMLFLLVLLLRIITSQNPGLMITQLVGLGGCVLALFLNRKGFIEIAGILIVVLVYAIQTLTILNAPGGLTVSGLPMLDFSVLPDVFALAFFSANSLFLIAVINIIQAWVILMYGPHDTAVTQLLHTALGQTFSHIYDLQLITAAVLYVWGRSVEYALARADRAEEIATFEKREKEQQMQELEQKRQLDAGIQQILQTHVAVANGDLNARAPLHQGHVLWQVAAALNNLISRHQRLSHDEQELRRLIQQESLRVANRSVGNQSSGTMPKVGNQSSGAMPKVDSPIRRFQEDRS
jgi:hypothetical protein